MDATKQKLGSLADQLTATIRSHGERLTASLAQGGLVPGPASAHGVIPEDFRPGTQLDISFDGKNVDLGNFFRASECKVSPSVSFQPEVCCRHMCIEPSPPAMTADAKSRPRETAMPCTRS